MQWHYGRLSCSFAIKNATLDAFFFNMSAYFPFYELKQVQLYIVNRINAFHAVEYFNYLQYTIHKAFLTTYCSLTG